MKFKGKLWGSDFDATEADSPVELFQILARDGEDDLRDVRCWVLVKSASRPYWLEVMLDDSSLFNIVSAADHLLLDEDSYVSVEFRRKPCNSPNTSPSKDATGNSLGESHTLSTLETFSSSDAKDHSTIFRNSIDPFTRCSFAEIETYLVLNFPSHDSADGVDAIFVDKESFEEYVQHSEQEGKNFDQLILANVELCDGSVQHLHLTWDIWVSSVLPASKVLRGSYHRVNAAEKAREEKLSQIKENESLWERVTFWIDDFADSEALERLEVISDDHPPYISPFYFRKEEAILLGRLDAVSPSVSLGDVLRAKSSTSTCAAHDLKPFLEEVFRLDRGFHLVGDFRAKKKAWVTRRQEELLQANKPPVAKKAPPTFGSFGIR